MCGRYYADDETIREIKKIVLEVDEKIKKSGGGDVYPSQEAVVLAAEGLKLNAQKMRWGFPQYNRKGLLINARAETVLSRKTFRDSVLHRRCIIPAKHFYEWDAAKNKVAFSRSGSQVLYMAGFYRYFQEENHFVIITTQANASVAQVHNRMPLVLGEGELEDWVHDDGFLEVALHKTPPQLSRYQEYEQQSLF